MRIAIIILIIIESLGLSRGIYELSICYYENIISIVVFPILIYFHFKLYQSLTEIKKIECDHDWRIKGFGMFEDIEVKSTSKRCVKCKKIEQTYTELK